MTDNRNLTGCAGFGTLITIIGIIVSLFVPEVRHFLGIKSSDTTINVSNDNFTPKTEQPIVEQPKEKPLTKPTRQLTEESKPSKQEKILVQSVYIESVESNFNKRSSIIFNKLETALSEKGYSFTDNFAQAGFRLKITATTRYHNSEYGLTVCYADVAVGLFDVSKNRSVFKDEFSQKGISSSREDAGRKALEDVVPMIVNNIPLWNEIINK